MPRARNQDQRARGGFECQICRRTYSKAEHLQRHERTHTGAKPFACPTCGRQFGRLDSLNRHERIHARAHGSRTESVWPSASNASTEHGSWQDTIHPTGNTESAPAMGTEPVVQDVVQDSVFSQADLDNLDMVLAWPDSENLLQSIVSSDWNSLALPMTMRQNLQIDPVGQESTSQLSPPNGSHEAIQSLSAMITSLSVNVTSAVEALPGLTSGFLDNCLQSYFAHFNTYFPILHRPTFVFQECSPSLILNAIALGSLYIGTDDAVSKGELLWSLAHTAVATSWQALMCYQGSYDSHPGVQLVLTAMLGQCYAMMSKNHSLRLTSQVFHSLGFNWASQCKMFSISLLETHSEDPRTPYDWKVWAAKQVHHRALVGHYILDGQLSFVSGQSTCTIHAANPLGFSSSPATFDAPSIETWEEASKETDGPSETTFRQAYRALFSEKDQRSDANLCLRSLKSPLDIRVILECLHSLVRENRASSYKDSIVEIPSLLRIKMALATVYELLQNTWSLDDVDRFELMLCWHFISMDTLCDSVELTDQMCRHLGLDQLIFRSSRNSKDFPEVLRWARESSDAKRAFLHATAVHDIMNRMPANRTHSFWTPFPLFATSVMYAILRWVGISTVFIPANIHWQTTLGLEEDGDEGGQVSDSQRSTNAFIASDLRIPVHMLGSSRNLAFELKRLQTSLHSLTIQWGISIEMERVLNHFQQVDSLAV